MKTSNKRFSCLAIMILAALQGGCSYHRPYYRERVVFVEPHHHDWPSFSVGHAEYACTASRGSACYQGTPRY